MSQLLSSANSGSGHLVISHHPSSLILRSKLQSNYLERGYFCIISTLSLQIKDAGLWAD